MTDQTRWGDRPCSTKNKADSLREREHYQATRHYTDIWKETNQLDNITEHDDEKSLNQY